MNNLIELSSVPCVFMVQQVLKCFGLGIKCSALASSGYGWSTEIKQSLSLR